MGKKHIDTAGILSLNLGSLDLYVRAIQAGSFSAVAILLNLAPSSVSRQINHLEEKLGGTPLLNRTHKGLVPTEAGWQLYEIAQTLLKAWEGFQEELSQSQQDMRGTLRIGCSAPVGDTILLGMLSDFMTRHPEILVDLRTANAYPDMVEEKLDLLIYLGPHPSDNLVARKLCESHVGLFASIDYLEKHGEPKTMSDLLAHNCLIYSHNGIPQPTLLYSDQGKREKITLKGGLITNSAYTLLQMVARGAGIGMNVGWAAAPLVKQGVIREILTQYQDIHLPIMADHTVYAIFPDRKSMPARVRVFLDELIRYIESSNP